MCFSPTFLDSCSQRPPRWDFSFQQHRFPFILYFPHHLSSSSTSPSGFFLLFGVFSYLLPFSCLKNRQLDVSFFVKIEIGQSLIVDDLDGEFKVTAFDANHCPGNSLFRFVESCSKFRSLFDGFSSMDTLTSGAVMFLFEGSFGNILHTGDCRLTLDCLHSLPEKYVGTRHGKSPSSCLDYVFLDCTFGKSSHKFPTKHSAIRQIINCIWNHPDAPVVCRPCDMLGQEDILLEVFRTFGSNIYVDKATNLECFRSLMVIVPEIVTEDPSSRFHIFSGFPKLYERASAKLAEARSKLQSEPLIILPSAQWYVCDDEDYFESGSQIQKQRKVRFSEAVKDEFGIWHVCYSMHSSKEELESAMHKEAASKFIPCKKYSFNSVRESKSKFSGI